MKSFNKLTKQEKKEYLAILFLLPFTYIGHLFRKANFRTLPKRTVAVCLAVVMIAVMMPIMSITANATEYGSGSTVPIAKIKGGDILYKGAIVDNSNQAGEYYFYKTASKNDTSGATKFKTLNGYSTWTVDTDYYVVKKSFIEIYLFQLSLTVTATASAGGTVSGGGTYNNGTGITLTATPNTGYSFVNWTENGSVVSTSQSYSFVVTGARNLVANFKANTYTISYDANGGSGTMANQSFAWGTAQNLTANAFTYTPKITFDENGGNAVSDASVAATFSGWEDRSTTTYAGTTYKYTDFDAPGYAIRNNDVFVSGYCSSVYNKDGLLNHYVNHGKNEYANGSASRAPNTGYIYGYPNGAKVSNLTMTAGGTVNLYAKWKYGKTTLPTPTRTGFTFKGWTGDLMDIATLTNGMEISDTSRGTIGSNASYAVTENLIPVVGGATYTSNYEVCGLYSFDANGNFIKRESSYATTHTLSSNAAFVRIEVNTTKGITFDQYQSGLTLTYTLPAGTSFPVGGNQTLTAVWSDAHSITFNYHPNGGNLSDNYITWVATADQKFPDSHWNFTNGTYGITRTGYTASGYFAKADGSCLIHEDYNFTSYADLCAKYGVSTSTQSTTIDIYAQWTPNNYTVNFNANGGSVGTQSKSVTYDSTYGTLPTPTRAGYTFDGWFTAAEGGSKVISTTVVKITDTQTLYAHWILQSYTVTWKNYDGSVLETDTGVSLGTTPTYDGATPAKPEDEKFTYTFNGWSPAVSAITGDTEYTAQFTAVSKRVEPAYTITIPATVNEGESFTVKATGVVLNTDQTLIVTLQSDFKFTNGQGAQLAFKINGGADDIENGTNVLSIIGNGDENTPIDKDSEELRIQVAEDAKYSGTYTGTITFTIAVNSAENN